MFRAFSVTNLGLESSFPSCDSGIWKLAGINYAVDDHFYSFVRDAAASIVKLYRKTGAQQ
jgi:hypothetical protein